MQFHRIASPRTRRFAAWLAAAIFAVAVAGCSGLTGLPASLPLIADSGVVYAINGAPAGRADRARHVQRDAAAGRRELSCSTSRSTSTRSGTWSYLPQRAVASRARLDAHGRAADVDTSTYETLVRAPGERLSRRHRARRRSRATVILVQSSDPNACSTSVTGTTIYAKIVVDVRRPGDAPADRFAITVDPNCGFRSFATGIPKD